VCSVAEAGLHVNGETPPAPPDAVVNLSWPGNIGIQDEDRTSPISQGYVTQGQCATLSAEPTSQTESVVFTEGEPSAAMAELLSDPAGDLELHSDLHSNFLRRSSLCPDSKSLVELCRGYAQLCTMQSRDTSVGAITGRHQSPSWFMAGTTTAIHQEGQRVGNTSRHRYGWHMSASSLRTSSSDDPESMTGGTIRCSDNPAAESDEVGDRDLDTTLSVRMKMVGLFARGLFWQVLSFGVWIPGASAAKENKCTTSALHPIWHIGSALAIHHVICYIAFHRALLVSMDAHLHWFPANFVELCLQKPGVSHTGPRGFLLRWLGMFRIVPWVTWEPLTLTQRLELLQATEETVGNVKLQTGAGVMAVSASDALVQRRATMRRQTIKRRQPRIAEAAAMHVAEHTPNQPPDRVTGRLVAEAITMTTTGSMDGASDVELVNGTNDANSADITIPRGAAVRSRWL